MRLALSYRRVACRVLAGVPGLLLVLLGALSLPAGASDPPPVGGAALPAQACADSPVTVLARDPADARDACRGARDATAFFAGLGIAPVAEAIALEIVQRLPEAAGTASAGCYLEARRRVLVLDYPSFRRYRTWFGVSIDRRLYRSVAAHEVAHALAACAFAVPNPTVQAREYLAYVAMLATMEPALRRRVLAHYPGQGFEDASRITAIYLMFEPMRFGVEAYRHFMRPGNGAAFVRAVLAGQALAD